MASIKFITKGKSKISNLYVRFFHSKEFDMTLKTGLLIDSTQWNNKLQRFKNISEEIIDKELTLQVITDLTKNIISAYNKSYRDGETINKLWLENLIKSFNNRPLDGNDYEVYFCPFITNYIESSKTRINPVTGKQIDTKTIQKYNTTLTRLKEFELFKNIRLKHSDIGLDFHKDFVSYLTIEGNYGKSTIEKYISQIKMYCREAEINGYNINPEYKSRRFTFRRQKALDPYLNIDEINSIYELNIENETLDKIRDLFIIGLWTGLRVSDFKQLKRMNIVNDNIVVASTKKTGKPAIIPIHYQVRTVLNKYNNDVPRIEDLGAKRFEMLFNEKIKELCQLAKITLNILGDKRNTKTNRDERGIYPKYQLVSSHICRRSFVSNHYGKFSNQAIMAITTHASEKQLLEYVKISNEEHIEEVRAYWKKENLKVV